MAKQRVLSSQGETQARALNVSTGQATEPVADLGPGPTAPGQERNRRRAREEAAGEAALLLLTDAGGATGDEGRQAWLQLHPARASGGEIVGDGGGETREKCEMRRGKRTREKIRVVRGAACGPADLSRSWMGTDDGNEGAELRTAVCPPRPARSPRVYLPHHELFFSDDDRSV